MGVNPIIDINFKNEHDETIAQGCLTNSKHVDRFIKGQYPNAIESAMGCHVKSTMNKQYIDFICGLGSCLFGYSNKKINDAIINEVHKGLSYSLPSKMELIAGRKVKEHFPFIERLKFLKTGTEAAMASLRIARAYTGRKYVLSQGYHGWYDEFVGLTPPACGVASDVFMHKLTDIEQITSEIAAVIIEPIELDNSLDRIKWLNALRKKCTETGTVLIFDEIITGIRYRSLSCAKHYNIKPDLILFGKALANGLPLSLIGGKKDLMDNDQYFVSSTFAGENASLASCVKVFELLASEYKTNELWENALFFQDQFNSIWPEKIYLDGYGVRSVFKGDPEIIALFWQEAVKAGYLFGPSFFFMYPHVDHIYTTLDNIRDILNLMKVKKPRLLGPMPSSPFSKKARK